MTRTRLAADTLRVLPRKRLSRAMGQLADLAGPRAVVGRAVDAFVRAYGVDMSEAVVPSGGYATFNDFFTRRLRDGARPVVSDPLVLTSPADGRVEEAGSIDTGSVFVIKNQRYELGELLGDDSIADRFRGGTFAVIYLAPPDYHRVHAPVSGEVEVVRHVAGTLYPVNAIGVNHIERLFARNERVCVHQRSERFGAVVTILVGAIGVGRISLAFDRICTNVGQDGGVRRYGPHEIPTLEKGAELGVFNLGSTVILLLEPLPSFRWSVSPGEVVRMGCALGRWDA